MTADAELHLHLEGAIAPETLHEIDPAASLAELRNIYTFSGFGGFIACFKEVAQRLRTPDHYALALRRLLQNLQHQQIRYAEVTLSAGVILWKGQEFAAIWDALRAEQARSTVQVVWNLDAIRQFGVAHAMQVAELAADRVNDGAVSFGIGGDELRGPAEWFGEVYSFARSKGLRLTAHAGETAGPESIWAALNIGAERIGHGIRAAEDPELLRHLRDRNLPLEVCITSNVKTGAVASLDQHPVRKLFDAGVPITLNTDDPAIFQTSLTREFQIAQESFGFSKAELLLIAANANRFRFA